MVSRRTEYLELTFNVDVPGVRQLLAEEVGKPQDGYSHVSVRVLKAVATEIGLDHTGNRPKLLTRLREEHPRLDQSRQASQLSRSELRELYASVAVGETISERPIIERSIANA